MTDLSAKEIAQVRAMLSRRKGGKAKTATDLGVTKVLVGSHGRVMGRVLVKRNTAAPKGMKLIEDDPGASVGMRVVRGKVVKKFGPVVYCDQFDEKGELVNFIKVNKADPPALPGGHKLVEREK